MCKQGEPCPLCVGSFFGGRTCDYGRNVGGFRLSLSTAIDNHVAQDLHEGAGWIRDDQFHVYAISFIEGRNRFAADTLTSLLKTGRDHLPVTDSGDRYSLWNFLALSL